MSRNSGQGCICKEEPMRRVLCLPEAPKERSTFEKIKEIYVEQMTLDGVSHFISSRNITSRLLWLALTILCTAVMTKSIVEMAQQLSSNDMTTKFETETVTSNMIFPSVTICNANPVNSSEMSADEESVRNNPEELVDAMVRNPQRFMTPLLRWRLGGTKSEAVSFFEPGWCTFSNKECSFSTHFRKTPGKRYCYTFNMNSGSLAQTRPGAIYGLSLVVNINKENSLNVLPMLTQDGVYVTLHGNGSLPHVVTHSYLAGPGQLTRFEIKRKDMVRLESPYKDNCTDGLDHNLLTSRAYTEDACLMSCQVQKLLDECECVDSFTKLSVHAATGVDLQECDSTGNKCYQQAIKNLLEADLHCDCPMLCEETQYSIDTSSAPWPSDMNYKVLNAKLKQKKGLNKSLEYMKENYVALQLYFKDFTIEKIIHEPAYSWVEFLSDLGGTMNFWLGASIFSVFEIIVFFMQAISLKVREKCNSVEEDRSKEIPLNRSQSPAESEGNTDHINTEGEHKENINNCGKEETIA